MSAIDSSTESVSKRAKTNLIFGVIALLVTIFAFVVGISRTSFFLAGCLSILAWLHWVMVPRDLNPLTVRKLKRFRSIGRGYWSLIILAILFIASCFAELFVNDRPLIMSANGKLFFPTYAPVMLGEDIGLEGSAAQRPLDFVDLDNEWEESGSSNWMLMPFVPHDPYESHTFEGVIKARGPTLDNQHYLGTDAQGRDMIARLVYGFRTILAFAIVYTIMVYLIGVTVGCLMGYLGRTFDLVAQRFVEIWSLIPFLYAVIFIINQLPDDLPNAARIGTLLFVMVIFGWIGMSYYMRTATYREKVRDYVAASQLLGAGNGRVIFNHILPNAISTVVTFMPFIVVGAVTSVTALDFLGFGLPPPTPSLGQLLLQGRDNLATAPWIILAAVLVTVFMLVLVTFVGEAVREASDPKKFTTYK